MCALVALFGLAGNAGAATRSGGTGTDPWVASELPDYSPGDTVSLIGGSWQPGESVHVVVNDDAGQTWSRTVDLTADANGGIGDSFTLPDWFVATYSVTATGATSGTATSSFTDGNVRARVAGGPTSASISWEKFNGNATCSGSPSSTGSGTVGTGTTGLGIPSGVDAGQSARLTAPALTGFTFSAWSGAASSSSTTVCVPGSNANQIDMVATYAPGMNTTTVAQNKTATYGDASATLTTTVTPASGSAVNSGTVTFTINGTSITSGTVSGGSASASFSLAGVQAGSYAIAATYNAGSGFNGSNNSGQTPAPTLTIAKAGSSTTVTCAAGPFVYNGLAKTPCSATVTGAGGLNQSLSVSYSDNVHAGTTTASASYAGDANHNPSSDSETFIIDKADSTTTVACAAGPFVYNGSAQTPCSASATGAGGLNQSLAVSYGNNINAGTATASATFAGDANHTGSSGSTSFRIDKASSTTTVSCPSGPFVYNGSAQTPCSANVTGAGGLEQSLTVDYGDNLHAGTATASASFAGGANHTHSSDSTSFTIDKREVTASITAADKTYDGSDEAEITSCSLESATDSHGVVSPDAVDCTASNGHFADANAGKGKAVNADVVLTGTAKYDYQLTTGTVSTSATLEKADLEISAVADSKTYDGTTDSSGTPTVSGLQGGDSVDGLAQRFQSKNVLGAGNSTLEVSAYSVHDGNSGGNYEIHTHAAAGTISAKGLTISGVTANDKTYDGTDAATVDWGGANLSGVVTGDDVAIDHAAYDARFDDRQVGSDKPVTVTGVALSGGDAGNYTVSEPSDLKADVGQARLDIYAAADSKTYDGTTDSSGNPTVGSGQVKGNDSVDGLSQAFQSKNVLGPGNSTLGVTDYAVHDGNSGGNYDVHTHTAAGTIGAKALTVTGAEANNKTYDGTASATADFSGASLAGVVSGDSVAIDHSGYSASFADKNVGTDKPVTVTGVALSGDDASNYTVSQPSELKADITPRAISGSFDSANKVYDGSVAAAATNRQLSGVLGSDDVGLSGGTAGFDTKNVGTGKPVTLSGAALVGADKDNYSLSSVAAALADITRRDLTVTAHGVNRTYDGTNAATVTLSTDKLAGDSVNASYGGAAFASKHAGPGKSVSVSGISISGADAGNYQLLSASAATTAEIFKRPLTVSAVADTKVYDGTTSSDETPTISLGTIAAGDTAALSQAFATKTVGSGKTLIPSGSVLDGNGGQNYAVAFLNAANGVITARNLTVSGITASDKPYDGNTSATLDVSGASLVGAVAGDGVSLGTGAATGAFTSSAPGTCAVQVSGLAIGGLDNANYTLTQPVVAACIGAWNAMGFYAPVGIGNSQFVTSPGAPPAVSPVSTTWNIAKGGSTIPLKFNLYTSRGGAERTNVADIRSFDAVKLSCTTGEGEAAVDFITTGNTSLRYDGAQFIQNWKTPSGSTDTCYRASVKFQDGSAIYAFFKLRK